MLRVFTSIGVLALAAAFLLEAPATGEEPISFELDVQPILTARGCNQGACHGKQRGQNGFQLSLLGFDSNFDHEALTMNARGRRVFLAAPERSLLLTKPTGELPHGGGKRITRGDEDYETIRRWIAQGAPRRIANEPTLQRITVEPSELSLRPSEKTPLVVTAFYSNGSKRNVTALTTYQSNESAIAEVNKAGEITAGPIPGETAIMSRYQNIIGVTNVVIPRVDSVAAEVYEKLPRNNFVDDLVYQKLQTLNVTPSPPASEATFLRRVFIDIIGRLPTAKETRNYLADKSSNKRAALVESLLARPEYVDHWANQWADLLRPNPYHVGIKATFNYDHWVREQFRQNRPYDEFVRELLTARGSSFRNGAVVFFRNRRKPEELTTMTSQLFLGVRLECAKCHHHPFEKWGQDDFYSFAAFFARLSRKGRGISAPISGDEEMIFPGKKGSVSHPLTGEVLPPRPLFGSAADTTEMKDPREALVDWMTADGAEFFSRVQVNRVWASLMGRGIVEPVDDLRSTNPPTNEPLLAALAEHFREKGYDQKDLIRTIVSSHVYSLRSLPNETNVADTRNYSRHYRRRMRAEVLLGAVDDVTGVASTYAATPIGSRPNQLWTTRVDSIFLDTFGRPNENEDPPCERLEETTVTQTLHLMNSPLVHRKVTDTKSLASQLAASKLTGDEIVEELYLTIYNRFPDVEERAIGRQLFAGEDTDRKLAAEDLMWALLNTPEFIFKN